LATIFSFRLPTWQEAVALWLKHPIAGVGLGWQQMMVATDIRSTPLHVAVELGAVGFILVIAALAFWFRETWRNEAWSKSMRIGLVAGMAALLVASLVSSPFASPVIAVAAALVVALGLSRTEAAEPATMTVPVRAGYAFATVIVLGGLGWSTVHQVARPMLAASRFDFAAQALAATDKRAEEQIVLALAERHAPGNNDLRLRRVENLVAQSKFDDAQALLAASKLEQLGPESNYWAGRVSEGLKDPQGALAAYERALAHLPASHNLVKPATERMAKLKPGGAAK
jgi:O-antigen ligase